MVITESKECINKLENFFIKEEQALNYYIARWEDEYLYENPQDYKNAIIEKAKKYNLNVKSVNLSPKGKFIKTTIQFDNYTGHIDCLKTKIKIYLTDMEQKG